MYFLLALLKWHLVYFSLFSLCEDNTNATVHATKAGRNLQHLKLLWQLYSATVVQEVDKSFSNQKVASSIPCRSVLEQDPEPLIAPDVQCHQCKCKMCIHCKSHICKSLWIKASTK